MGTRSYLRRGLIFAAILLAALLPLGPAHAQAVITNAWISSGSSHASSTQFPSGTGELTFGYTVQTADPDSVVEVDMLTPDGIIETFNYVPSADPGPQTSQLSTEDGSSFPDGGYCIVLQIDGSYDTAGGSIPIPLTIGNAAMPDCAAVVSAFFDTTASTATPTLTVTATTTPLPTATPTASTTPTPIPDTTASPTVTAVASGTPTPVPVTPTAMATETPFPVTPTPIPVTPTPIPVTETPIAMTPTPIPTQPFASAVPPPSASPTATRTPIGIPTRTPTPAATYSTPASGASPPSPTLTPAPSSTPSATPGLASGAAAPQPSASASSGAPKHFVLALGAPIHARRFNTFRVVVHGVHGHPVLGVEVRLDGRSAGLEKIRIAYTDNFGVALFPALWPRHPGHLSLLASKPGWTSIAVTVPVQ